MGACKVVSRPELEGRTFTIIGTPHYMAPEVLEGKGYTGSVDYWSLGVCMFEFMCGYLPFGEDADDPYEIYHCIRSRSVAFPADFPDQKAKELMGQLLDKTPEARAGSPRAGSLPSLREHSWFQNFPWVHTFP